MIASTSTRWSSLSPESVADIAAAAPSLVIAEALVSAAPAVSAREAQTRAANAIAPSGAGKAVRWLIGVSTRGRRGPRLMQLRWLIGYDIVGAKPCRRAELQFCLSARR